MCGYWSISAIAAFQESKTWPVTMLVLISSAYLPSFLFLAGGRGNLRQHLIRSEAEIVPKNGGCLRSCFEHSDYSRRNFLSPGHNALCVDVKAYSWGKTQLVLKSISVPSNLRTKPTRSWNLSSLFLRIYFGHTIFLCRTQHIQNIMASDTTSNNRSK